MKDPNYDLVLKTTCATLLTDKANTVMGLAIRLGNTPRRYLELGFPDLPLAVKVANVEKMLFRRNVPRRFLEGIYGTLLAPKAIFRSHTCPHDVNAVVLSFDTIHLGPLVAILHADKQIGRARCNELASIYAKEDRDFERVWRAKGLLLWEGASERGDMPTMTVAHKRKTA